MLPYWLCVNEHATVYRQGGSHLQSNSRGHDSIVEIFDLPQSIGKSGLHGWRHALPRRELIAHTILHVLAIGVDSSAIDQGQETH